MDSGDEPKEIYSLCSARHKTNRQEVENREGETALLDRELCRIPFCLFGGALEINVGEGEILFKIERLG